MAGPKAQALDGDWYDDPLISNDDQLIRVVKTGQQIVRLGDGTYALSPQLWTSQQGGCSVELTSLIESGGESVEARCGANSGLGAVEVNVGAVRATMNRIDDKKQPFEPLGVAHTPIPADHPYGPNPFHCDIFPKLGNPGRNLLHQKARVVIPLDQVKAAEIYAQRHGITPASKDPA